MSDLRERFRAVASEKFGGLTGLAAALGCSTQALRWWRTHYVPAERVVEIERVTGIPREELRPDLYR
jgi:DNA-binding transcriptional regulator YdaS (Cro superfamily)